MKPANRLETTLKMTPPVSVQRHDNHRMLFEKM